VICIINKQNLILISGKILFIIDNGFPCARIVIDGKQREAYYT